MLQKRFLISFSILAIIWQAVKCQTNEENENEAVQGNDKNMEVEASGVKTDITKTADYLNKKIKQLLQENISIDSINNNLAAALNAARSELEQALINKTATEEEIEKAEKALENFQTFLQQYRTIEGMLKVAQQDLNDYETDSKHTLEQKYEALMLLLKIQNSSTLEKAEMVLKLYENFKDGNTKAGNESNLSSLSDEHKKYFEEILQILKDNFMTGSAEMENILKEILKSPELLKKLYEALQEFSEEEEDDFLEDLWSWIF